MSKGLSWRQLRILRSLAGSKEKIVAWKDVDYGPTGDEQSTEDYLSARNQRNLEQVTRRSLRSLEKRGLVELGRYVFEEYPDWPSGTPSFPAISRQVIQPEKHVPGDTRIMTGVKLTPEGKAVAEASAATRKHAT